MAEKTRKSIRGRSPGKLLKTPWGYLRSQAYLRGLEVPPLGTPQDLYLQLLMIRENEKEFAGKLLNLYSLWATVPGDGASRFAEQANKQLETLQRAYFPYAKGATREDRDKRDMKMVERLFANFGEQPKEKKGKPK